MLHVQVLAAEDPVYHIATGSPPLTMLRVQVLAARDPVYHKATGSPPLTMLHVEDLQQGLSHFREYNELPKLPPARFSPLKRRTKP